MRSFLSIEGGLDEDNSANTATIDGHVLAKDSADSSSAGVAGKINMNWYDFAIAITGVGTATSVTVTGQRDGAAAATTIATGAVAGDEVRIVGGVYDLITLTWTGGTPNGAGTGNYVATRKFLGLSQG